EAEICKDQLTRGETFEEVAALHLFHNPAWADSVPNKKLKWGEALPEIEDSLFIMQPNEYAGPFKVDNEFFFFKLVNKKSEVFFTEADYNYWCPSIEKRISRHKKSVLFTEFLQNVMQGTKVTVPREKFNHLCEEIEVALEIQQATVKKNLPDAQNVAEKDFINLQERLKNNLDEPFAIFSDGKTWSYRAILEKLKYGPYPLNTKSSKNLRSSLNRALRFMFEVEALAEKAKNMKLDQSQYVKEETRMWQDNILASALRQSILDTAYQPTEADYQAFYEKNKKFYLSPAMVKIQEILVDDPILAQQLLNRIKNGEDFARLAKKYSKRALSTQKGGISGYFTVSALGKVGESAFRSEIGKLNGPIKTEENQYSIFKLLDKKDRQPQPYNDIKDEIQKVYQTQEMNKILENYVQSKVSAYHINVNRALFDSLKVVDQGSGMFVLKQHFPGRTAVPLVNPTDTQKSWYHYILGKLQ
ncbi:peptidyl-prolyl cis-trans isomerase, partial [candidate division KSB1 bacterium]|nr:peptidyl-prolyl cis-trans isomerase [candidate division KSB1 bacterium]